MKVGSAEGPPGKRGVDADNAGGLDADAAGRPSKVARLAEDRVARVTVGANVVECDGKTCTHEVAWPLEEQGPMGPPAKRDGPAAREYPFKIDPFQQTSINCLEAGG
jgi:ATP-dependent RNA helicase DOB1